MGCDRPSIRVGGEKKGMKRQTQWTVSYRNEIDDTYVLNRYELT